MRRLTTLLALAAVLGTASWLALRLRQPEWTAPAEKVGHQPARDVLPDNTVVTPAGRQVELPGLRPQAIALSPDGRLLVTSGKTAELVVIDPATAAVTQRVALPPEDAPKPVSGNILSPDRKAQLSFTGLVFSPDGSRLYMSNVNGSVKVFTVAADGTVAPSFTIPLPPAKAPQREQEIPAGLAVSADGTKLYVAGNLSNRVFEVEATTGTVERQWTAGFAPYDVALAKGKLYVSNWGGRLPEDGDFTAHAGRGTHVRADRRTGVASEGSVTIIDLAGAVPPRQVVTGRHASDLAVSPDGAHVVVANAADDYVSVLSTETDSVVEKIWTKKTPADLFGAAPNALTFSADGEDLYVCNGTQNAVAIIEFNPGQSELEGLIPTGWYPGAIAFDAARRSIHVANVKGRGSGTPPAEGKPAQFISTQYFGSVSLIPLPRDKKERATHTDTVLHNYRDPLLRTALLPARPFQPPRPVPERVGEPSVFRHVLYVIKENRTYDQVLGDMPEGDGDPSLCIFGEKVTPNQHKLCREFVLLDNAYCSGILSADGHNWSCSAITTDYMEKQFAGFPRSYPDGSEHAGADALAWSPAGFIWDAALAKGRSVRIFGEFANAVRKWRDPHRPGKPDWAAVWRDYHEKGNAVLLDAEPTIKSLEPHVNRRFPAWDKDVTDVQRADVFLEDLREWERTGVMPNLMVMSLSMDHTSGTVPGYPTPAAQVADNDLAFGRMVEAISRSQFWKDTLIVAIEDDPQNGWDHVTGYRTTAYVVSAWTKRGAVIHTQYNQTSLLRTIELVLGLPPMNQLDATATPMSDCFADAPDLRPFEAVPNQIPLDQMNPARAEISDPLLRQHAEISETLPLDKLDACPEDTLNRILWHAQMGSATPYPSWAVAAVEDDDDDAGK